MKNATTASRAAANRLPPPITANRPVVLPPLSDRDGRGVAVGRAIVGCVSGAAVVACAEFSATAWAVGESTEFKPVAAASSTGLLGVAVTSAPCSVRSPPPVSGAGVASPTARGADCTSGKPVSVALAAGLVCSAVSGVLVGTGVFVDAGALAAAAAATDVLIGIGVFVATGVLVGAWVLVGTGVLVLGALPAGCVAVGTAVAG